MVMIHTKRVILMIVPLLFVPVAYGISSTPNACAVPQAPGYSEGSCGATTYNQNRGHYQKTCCWEELVPGKLPPLNRVTYCQTCYVQPDQVTRDCDAKVAQLQQPPTTGESVLPGGGVAEQPNQPLFGGQNDAAVPPTGGVGQPPAATTQPAPGGGAGVPTEGGSAEQPTAPQDDQDNNQGGGLPTIKNQENVPPGGGVAEQPEDDGQEDSSEGAETPGPLT
jgi:hypothetical protein